MKNRFYDSHGRWLHWLFLIVVFIRSLNSTVVIKTFADFQINNILVGDKYIYLGGINSIQKLNDKFDVVEPIYVTGPKKDNPHCGPTALNQVSCTDPNYYLTDIDNINKILLITKTPVPMLIACGTVFQGICEFLDPDTLQRLAIIYDNSDIVTKLFSAIGGVSANLPEASTTSFIYNGNTNKTTVLFSAKTMTFPHPFKGTMASIRRVKLGSTVDDLKTDFLKDDDEMQMLFKFEVKPINQIKVNYVSSFYIADHAYFMLTQKREFVIPTSKIARASISLQRYVELGLSCKSNTVDYKLLISTTLVKSDVNQVFEGVNHNDNIIFGLFGEVMDTKSLSGKYAVCSFMLKNIDEEVSKALKVKNCLEKVQWYDDDSCSNTKVILAPNIIVDGKLWHETKQKSTSLFGYAHSRGISLYLPSLNGKIKMFDVTKNGLYKFDEYKLSNNPFEIFNKFAIGRKKETIFTISNTSIAKFPIEDCDRRKTCKTCLSGPGCGWCTLENKCTNKSDCAGNSKTNYFIDTFVEKCPSITNVSPNITSIKNTEEISFETNNIPYDVSYKCAFNGLMLDGAFNDSVFICKPLSLSQVPKLKAVNGAAEVTLLLLSTTNKKVISSILTVYNCNSVTMCKSCISGIYNCGWCSESNKCSDSYPTLPGCPSGWTPYQGKDSSKHEEICPQVTAIVDKHLPNNVKSEIILNGTRLPSDAGSNKYQCSLKIEGKTQATIGKRHSDTKLICQKNKFLFLTNNGSYNAQLSVSFGNTLIDTTDLNVTLFKCKHQRKDCSVCMGAPSSWNCGWCESTSVCSVQEQCTTNLTNICPKPVITKVNPLEASIGGGTEVTIEGTDLGLKTEDIISITLAGQNCTQLVSKYKVSNRVVCKTLNIDGPISGKVEVQVKSKSEISKSISKEDFNFRKPVVNSFEPISGPCSGGTKLSIKGSYLNIGNSVTVSLGKLKCKNVISMHDLITCTTEGNTDDELCRGDSKRKRKRRSIPRSLQVEFDGYFVHPIDRTTFQYEENPLINNLYTYKESVHLKTFESGGQVILVEGKRLDIIQNPTMIFLQKSWKKKRSVDCTFEGSHMVCLAPNVSDVVYLKNSQTSSTTISVGFSLDGVNTFIDFRTIEVVPDPVFDSFPGGISEVKSEDLILTGRGFNVIDKKDVKVTIAGLPCNVSDLDERLVCALPSEKEILRASTSPNVLVYIGRGNLSYSLGTIKFYKVVNEETSWIVYVAPACAGLLILVIIIVILCVLYRRKHKKDKEYHELVQIRMDRMESQYARECKEAFADYQTEITDLTSDVDKTVSPYLDFRQYAMRVLYPGLSSHPILEVNRDSSPEWESSMNALVDLLKEKEFLLSFVRTLESQSSFQMTDRCIVASLLMVSLQDNVRYVTEILKELLIDLINKAGSGKRPKLLLRRTESIAEKLLTNWLAYTLHGFLEGTVGEPLFKLFSAINILLEKEPIDAITSDAKNSLSEDKLLRQKVDFKTMTLNVEYVHDAATETFTEIIVLSCDTISQAKEKIVKHIYKDKPYSAWPMVEDLVLGSPTASGAILVLKDEDSTSMLEGEWKKINTLEHYKVPDNANLRIATVQHSDTMNDSGVTTYPASPPRVYKSSLKRRILSHSLRSMQDIGKSDAAMVNNVSMPSVAFQPGLSSTSTPMLHHTDVNEPKLWHMVKIQDYPQEQKEDMRQSKMMAEVFLTRLLKTKETLQSFVNKLFDSIFGLVEGERTIPPSVKYLFDFLDEQCKSLEIEDDEVRHTWKNNSLPLRFWINMIKNPNFIFDINKSNTVDSCLSVIAQLFMDSCSPDEHRLGKDSPSNKLLYAKEIPEYKKKVKKFYEDVFEHELDEEEFFESLDVISEKYGKSFNSCNSARELMTYAVNYKVKVMDDLEQNGYETFAERLQSIMENMPDD